MVYIYSNDFSKGTANLICLYLGKIQDLEVNSHLKNLKSLCMTNLLKCFFLLPLWFHRFIQKFLFANLLCNTHWPGYFCGSDKVSDERRKIQFILAPSLRIQSFIMGRHGGRGVWWLVTLYPQRQGEMNASPSLLAHFEMFFRLQPIGWCHPHRGASFSSANPS